MTALARKRMAGLCRDGVEPPAFAPDLVTYAYFTALHDHLGAAEMGRVADGVLEGLAAAFVARVGAEAGYERLQRHADRMALAIIEGRE